LPFFVGEADPGDSCSLEILASRRPMLALALGTPPNPDMAANFSMSI
jgi:hypothetical protein